MLWPLRRRDCASGDGRPPMPLPAPVPQRPAAARLARDDKDSAVATLSQSRTMPDMTSLPVITPDVPVTGVGSIGEQHGKP